MHRKPLVGLPLTLEDLKEFDYFCGRSLETLEHPEVEGLTRENLEDIMCTDFTTALSDGVRVALIPEDETPRTLTYAPVTTYPLSCNFPGTRIRISTFRWY